MAHLTRYAFGAAVLVFLGVAAAQQKKSPATAAAKQPARTGLAVDDVIKLAKAGVSEDIIISLVRKNGKAFNLSAQQVLQLKQASVSDNVIKVMLAPEAEVQPAAAAPPTAPEVLPPELPPAAPAPAVLPPESPGPPAAPAGIGALTPVPDETGVYWMKDGRELVRIEAKALSNVRTGNVLAHSATLGIRRMRINAQLKGAKAETRVRETQPQFCLYLPESASVGDYLLLRMVQGEGVRQIEIGQSRLFRARAGVDHAMEIEYSQQRVQPRLHVVVPKTTLRPGEYAFYCPGGADAKFAGRVYDFGVDP